MEEKLLVKGKKERGKKKKKKEKEKGVYIKIHRCMWKLDFNLIYEDRKEDAHFNIGWPTWDIL